MQIEITRIAGLLLLVCLLSSGCDDSDYRDIDFESDNEDEGGTIDYGEVPGPCYIEHDINGDGTMIQRTSFEYDYAGRVILEEFDRNNNGSATERWTWTYDTYGYLSSWSHSDSGESDSDTWGNATHNADGDVLSRKSCCGTDIGVICTTSFYTYLAPGKILTQETHKGGDYEDNQETSFSTFYYDENEFLVRVEFDEGINGSIETERDYINDSDGNVLRERFYQPYKKQGCFYDVIEYTYDKNGNMLSREIDSWGADYYCADGVVETRTTWTYDSDGNNLMTETDGSQEDPADGDPEYRVWFTYNEDGNVVLTETDGSWEDPADGDPDHRAWFTYDEDGNVVLEEMDIEADGIIDTIKTYSFDENGNITEFTTDEQLDDDFLDERRTYTYDASGNLLMVEGDGDQYTSTPVDGKTDQFSTYNYDCWT